MKCYIKDLTHVPCVCVMSILFLYTCDKNNQHRQRASILQPFCNINFSLRCSRQKHPYFTAQS